MKLLSAFIEKAYCYPLNHLTSRANGQLFFQARGDGLYPVIKDGDILRIHRATPADLRRGDLTVLERPGGQFAIQFVLKGKSGSNSLRLRNPMHGKEGGDKPERLVGSIAAIEREGRTKKCDDRFARLYHLIYLSARPLIRILFILRKVLSLLHPRFFVRDAGSSLRCVTEKYNDANEVLYYSQCAFEGLDEQEQLAAEQFMKRKGRVLNIGCGAGREAFALAEAGFEVVGIDIAPGMIAAAKRHAQTSGKNVHFEVKDATALDYPSQSFDYVWISAGVYSHIPTRQLRIDTLRRIKDLLMPNGILFFSVAYRGDSLLPRVSLYGVFRRIAKPILKKRLHSEPGDMLVPYVSPGGTPSKLCYVHLFKDSSEVLEEITLAGLDGFEDEKSNYWIVKPCREGILHEVVR